MAEIGWRVVDGDGNVVQSGTVAHAQMADQIAELLGIDTKEIA